MAGRKAAGTVTRYAGLQVQTSSMGLNIPVGWGTFRCRCNLLDYLDFKAKAQKASSGKGGGSTTTGYTYSATLILGICEGPIDRVSSVYVDGKTFLTISQAGLSLATGAIGQAVWSYLTTAHPTHAIGYSGLAYAYAENYRLDDGATTPSHSFEVVRLSGFAVGANRDADASLIVADFFQNTRTGVPLWPANALDTPSLTSNADSLQNYTLAAGLLLSPVIDDTRSASDWLQEFLLATNSTVVWSEGVLKFIPYGDTALTGNGKTYTPNLTPVYALTDDSYFPDRKTPPVSIDIEDQSDAYNVVQLEYLDRSNQYNMAVALASDAANIAQFDRRIKDPDPVHMICTVDIASIAAQLYLQRTLYVRAQYTMKLSDSFDLLEPGDLLDLNESALGLVNYPVRIISDSEDEKGVHTFVCEDAQIGTANTPLYTMQNGIGTQLNTGIDPGGVETNLLLQSGDQTSGTYVTINASVTANGGNDQYGLNTADLLNVTGVAIGTPSQLGSAASAAGATTLVTTTLVDSPAGTLQLLIAAHGTAAATISGVVDSGSNTYTAGTQITNGTVAAVRPFYSPFTSHLPVGATATTTFSTATVDEYAALISIPGIASSSPLDTQAAGTTGTGTAPSIATGTLGNANDIVVGFVYVAGGAADAFTEAAGWTTGGTVIRTSGGALHWAYKIVAATTTQTYNPTLGTSRSYAANVMSFKRAAAALAVEHTIAQGLSVFAGLNYTFSICLDNDVHRNARVFIGDSPDGAVINGAYLEVDANAGSILTAGTAVGNATLVAANLVPTLDPAIWNALITVQFPAPITAYAGLSALSDAGALLWAGDGSAALFMSQWQAWQGLQDGRVYAATTTAAAGPLIFNPPSVLNTAGNSGWAAVAGGPYWGGCNVWVTFDGALYEEVGTISGPARYGVLTALTPITADPDVTNSFAVDLGASGGELSSSSATAADNGSSLCLIDNELVCFSDVSLTNPSRYTLVTYLRRGYLNTAIASHAIGDPFVRLDSAIFDFPYFAPNIGVVAGVKFQSFNLWGGGLQSLADCIEYGFTPGPLGSRAPAVAVWTAVGTSLSNAGVATPVILITGASDNPNAQGVVFYYRQTGSMTWLSAGVHPPSTVFHYITGVASSQTYDVGVAYQVNGVIGAIQIIASAITVGAQSSGYAPGSVIINSTVTGAGNITLPAGPYTHVDVYICNLGGAGFLVGGKSYQYYGGSGASSCIKANLAAGPGVVISWNLSSTVGTPSTATCVSPAMSLSAPSGINATSGGSGAAPAAATGGTTNYTGHAGGLTHTWDGGGCFDINGAVVDQVSLGGDGTSPGGGASTGGAPAPAQIIIVARP